MFRSLVLLCCALLLLGAASAFAFPAIDLTGGATDVLSAVDGTIWSSNITQPTGTGVYQPFVRVQNRGSEEGFNTDFDSPVPLDAKGGIWTHSVQWNTLTTFTKDGKDYYVFQLDANEPQSGTSSLISLDELKIYTSSNAEISTKSALEGSTLLYDLDGTADQTIYIETALKPGSGTDDVTLYIPTSFFDSVNGTDYMYFYSQFGLADGDGLRTDATFEEWRALQGGNEIPEPGTLALFGAGLLGLASTRLRRK